MFLIFAILMTLVLILGLYWMFGKWMSLYGIDTDTRKIKLLRIGLGIFTLFLSSFWNIVGLIAVHLIVFFLLTELIAFFIRRHRRKNPEKMLLQPTRIFYRSGLIPVFLTAVFMIYGYWNMGHIVKTEYTVESDKLNSGYSLLLLSDIHAGTIQKPEILENKIAEMNSLKPDFVVLAGDIVEEGTSKKSMEDIFKTLGKLKSRYGTYYVFGNHDRQNYIKNKAYSEKELENTILSNGIHILKDSWTKIGNDIVLAGREDLTPDFTRLTAEELLNGADRNLFTIVADHRPVNAEENAGAGADLMISGHTHGGQIFPVGVINEITGLNYGMYKKNGFTAVVSSGTAGWGFPIRTEGKCEYVLISLKSE